jgi:hypothetical protein
MRDAMRSTNMTVTYPSPFRLSGYPDELPPGSYELLVQEESVLGPGPRTHRWTAAYLTIDATTRKRGRKERRPLNGPDLERALGYRGNPPSPRSHAVGPVLEDRT